MFIVKMNHQYCKLCALCIELCPKKNLTIKDHRLAEFNRCVGCGLCEQYCPDMAIQPAEIEEEHAKVTPTG